MQYAKGSMINCAFQQTGKHRTCRCHTVHIDNTVADGQQMGNWAIVSVETTMVNPIIIH